MSSTALSSVSLDDKYTLTTGRIYLSGIHALVRLMLVQQWRDRAAGLNTAGFVSGYRGSPLGGLDEALWSAERHLTAHNIKFVPGVNEELAATAVWGTQQLQLTGGSDFDGVYGLWYGKGPGVDRCGDVFKHMSHAGTSRHGGILLVAGDDHGAYSSTLPNQSDHMFAAAMIPMLYPQGVEEYVELGLHGFAMSRFSGLPVGFKALADTVESSISMVADIVEPNIVIPQGLDLPQQGLHARLSTDPLGVQARKQEKLMQDHKIYAAIAYARENRLNRVTLDSPNARLGIIASGKAYRDVQEALRELGISADEAKRIGIRLFKVAMPWPLEPDSVRNFAKGLEEILVVEEKRQIVEYQLKEQLYNWRADVRPRVMGKFDESGEWGSYPRGTWMLPATGDLSVAQIARVIAKRLKNFYTSDTIIERLAILDSKDRVMQSAVSAPVRSAWYCSGCPHNRSTRVPEGSIALAGIGCHVMATAIYPNQNATTTHMGGEGAPWIGQAWFSKRRHIFANLGDGTYYHSGSMAIRAAIAAKLRITYKILYNDAVAMTGGQPVDGPLTAPRIVRQLAAEGVVRVAVVSENPSSWHAHKELFNEVQGGQFTLHHRRDLDAVQRELSDFDGVSVLLYEQVCAAEKRRRRKRGTMPAARRQVFINEAVCEGCGDCGVQSNCTALIPVHTSEGIKRGVNQSACNADESCLDGFCPSFVTIEGKSRRRSNALLSLRDIDVSSLPDPSPLKSEGPYNILITGIGGTGVVTVGALIGMAAHLESKGVSVLDMTGMSQKNGAVTSHVRIGDSFMYARSQRIPVGEVDLLLGCDLLTSGASEIISRLRPDRTCALVNSYEIPPGEFTQDPEWNYPADEIKDLINAAASRVKFLDATTVVTKVLGSELGANLFMLGLAFQNGWVPLSAAALERAVEINGVAIESNILAFRFGRQKAYEMAMEIKPSRVEHPIQFVRKKNLDDLVKDKISLLRRYQGAGYARRYMDFVKKVQRAEKEAGGSDKLTTAVAESLAKLMAYKDEYEVARLYSESDFLDRLRKQFEGRPKVEFHLAPPILSRKNAEGLPLKRSFGPWMLTAFHVLARLRVVRGTKFDPFGYTEERRMERQLIQDYMRDLDTLLPRLASLDREAVLELARLPLNIRGYGHVKLRSVNTVKERWQSLLARLNDSVSPDEQRQQPSGGRQRERAVTVSL